MKIFLSYASEQREIATSLAHRLRSNGYKVLFDASDIMPSESFDAKINTLITQATLFIFLASEDSVLPGCYALTELRIAESQWPSPVDRVLPVIVDNISVEMLPSYIRSVSILTSRGDLIGDVLSAVGILRRKHLKRMLRYAMFMTLAIALVVAGLWQMSVLNVSGPPNQLKWFDDYKMSAQDGAYLLSASLRNATDEPVSVISLYPEFESKDGNFPSTFNYTDTDNIPPGQSRTFTVTSSINEGAIVPAGKWRVCWQFVATKEIFENINNPHWQIDFHAQTQCSDFSKDIEGRRADSR